MKRLSEKAFICLLVLTMVIGLYPSILSMTDNKTYASLAASFAGGSGTEGDPYQITNATQLEQLRQVPAASEPYYFKLVSDIDLEGYENWNPINNMLPDYYLDGKGYKITHLTVNRPSSDSVGLFQKLYEGQVIQNLTVEVNSIVARSFVGGIAGENAGQIINSSVTGVSATESYIEGSEIGGLVGMNNVVGKIEYSTSSIEVRSIGGRRIGGLVGINDGMIKNSSSNGPLRVMNSHTIGGLVGQNEGTIFGSSAEISNIHDTAAETRMGFGVSALGGLVGTHSERVATAKISFSYATGSIEVSQLTSSSADSRRIGGLVGSMYGGIIDHSYARVDIQSRNIFGAVVGGLVGYAAPGYGFPNTVFRAFQILNSYAAGTVRTTALLDSAGRKDIGGLIGSNDARPSYLGFAIIQNTYYLDDPAMGADSTEGIQLDETAMKNPASYSEWDFTRKWIVDSGNDGFPQHQAGVMEVIVSPGSKSSNINETHSFTASIHSTSPAAGGPQEQVDWSVVDGESAVTIDANGLVTVGGTALQKSYTIKATSISNPTVSGTASLSVTLPRITGIDFGPSPQTSTPLAQGETVQLYKNVYQIGNAPTGTSWHIEKSDFMTIDENDRLTVAGDATPGPYKVTIRSVYNPDYEQTHTYTVSVPYIKSITVKDGAASTYSYINQGASKTYVADVSMAGIASTAVTWSTTIPRATIEEGILHVPADSPAGTYEVRATSVHTPSKFDTIPIYLQGVSSVTVNPATQTMEQGQKVTLTATVEVVPWDLSKAVTWSTDDTEGNITVDSATGEVTISDDAEIATYTVRATSSYNTAIYGTATITLIDPITAVNVSPPTKTILQGKTATFTATVVSDRPDVNQAVTWTSDSNAITVDGKGQVTVAADAEPDDYTITATSVANTNKSGTATITVTKISSITLNESQVTLLAGGTVELEADVQVVGIVDDTVTWSSNDPDAVTVDANGVVTVAVDAAPNDYKIRATSNADTTKYTEATIKVITVTGVTVTPQQETVHQGHSQQLIATVAVTNGTAPAVTWSSSSTDVVVDANGLVTVSANAAPTTYTITATSVKDPSVSSTAEITVTAVTGVQVTPSTSVVLQGGTQLLSADVTVEGNADQRVTWSSDNSKIAVSTSGLVTVAADAPVADYTVTATSTADASKKGTATIRVSRVTGVTLNKTEAILLAGDTSELSAVVAVEGAAANTVTWTSSNDSAVTVDANGLVTVLATAPVADYTITATSSVDVTKKATANIKVIRVTSVNVTPSVAIVHQGKQQQLSAAVAVVNGTAPAVTWSSSSTDVVVDANGLVTVSANAAPTTYTITATSMKDPNVSGEAIITVTAVTDVQITPSTSFVLLGGTQQLNTEVTVVGDVYQTVTWSVNGTPLTVSESGLVTVPANIAVGNYTVTATSTTDTSKQGIALIIAGEVTGVTLVESEVTLVAGKSVQLAATADVNGDIPNTVTWSSTSSDITVSEAGYVTVSANAEPNNYTITATSSIDNSKYAMVTLRVIEVTEVAVTPEAVTLNRGGTEQLTANVSVTNGTAPEVTWSSNNNAVTVSPTGLVTVTANAGAGQYIITATSTADNSRQGTATITVIVPTSPGGGSSTPETTPVSTIPGGSTPNGTTPGSTIPGGSTPGDTTPAPANTGDRVFQSSAIRVEEFVNKVEERVNAAIASVNEPVLPDTEGHWASATIDLFVKLNFISGYGDGSFKPNGEITRAEFATIIYNIFDLNAGERSVELNDVNNHWAKTAIQSLAEAGIINGYGNGDFRPDKTISREEIVIILSRIVNFDALEKDSAKGQFSDIDSANTYAVDIIKSAAQAGLINGKGNDQFDPQGEATRAEALTIILNALKFNPNIASILEKLN